MKRKTKSEKPLQFVAYNMTTKKKNRVILNPVISKSDSGSYIARGKDDDGTDLSCLITKEEADAVIKSGYAK